MYEVEHQSWRSHHLIFSELGVLLIGSPLQTATFVALCATIYIFAFLVATRMTLDVHVGAWSAKIENAVQRASRVKLSFVKTTKKHDTRVGYISGPQLLYDRWAMDDT